MFLLEGRLGFLVVVLFCWSARDAVWSHLRFEMFGSNLYTQATRHIGFACRKACISPKPESVPVQQAQRQEALGTNLDTWRLVFFQGHTSSS